MSKFCVGRECFWPFLALLKKSTKMQHLFSLSTSSVHASFCWITEGRQRPVSAHRRKQMRIEDIFHCRWGWARSEQLLSTYQASLLGAAGLSPRITLFSTNLFGESSEKLKVIVSEWNFYYISIWTFPERESRTRLYCFIISSLIN